MDMNQSNTAHNGLTVPAAAARAGVDQLTIREAIHSGDLPSRERIILDLDASDVDAWNARRQVEATS